MTPFARITNGRESWMSNARVPRHRHDQAYAAIVLSGYYEECGSLGRFRIGMGDVLLHGRFEAHLDRFGSRGARILNLVIPEADGFRLNIGCVSDADAIVRTATTDPAAAATQLCEQLVDAARRPSDWPDLLAADLLENPQLNLGNWARRHRLAAATISRGFRKIFGLSPAGFRAEARGRHAFAEIDRGTGSLAGVAAACGFADQAHMSRAIRALTGQSPGHWRATSNPFKTAIIPAA
ncbi:MAG TPA: helix-turn-helix domain-containing protein [Rhizomicrobium sp.]|jgi:AraC-like DNA-binding protein|nr:helix-turn-helix domain-containing protein [Rhizomicrobium sp.]